jgi:hypothetical protein
VSSHPDWFHVDGKRGSVERAAGHGHAGDRDEALALGREDGGICARGYSVYSLVRREALELKGAGARGCTAAWYRFGPLFRNWFQALFREHMARSGPRNDMTMFPPISVSLSSLPRGHCIERADSLPCPQPRGNCHDCTSELHAWAGAPSRDLACSSISSPSVPRV